jgi:hypothetical protein
VTVVGVQLQVGCGGVPVEVEREVIGGEDLAERHGSRQVGFTGHETVVDAEVT